MVFREGGGEKGEVDVVAFRSKPCRKFDSLPVIIGELVAQQNTRVREG